jgi:hypothetical protein
MGAAQTITTPGNGRLSVFLSCQWPQPIMLPNDREVYCESILAEQGAGGVAQPSDRCRELPERG